MKDEEGLTAVETPEQATTRRMSLDQIIDAVTRASTGSIKILESVLPLLKMVVTVTYDVSETLKSHGIEVEHAPVDVVEAEGDGAARSLTSQALTAMAIKSRALGLIYNEQHKED